MTKDGTQYYCPSCSMLVEAPVCPTCGIDTFDASFLKAPGSDPRIGSTILDRYRLDRLIGVGGMGAVYEGVRLADGAPVAVKILLDALSDNPEYVQRIHREAALTMALESPNTVKMFDFGRSEAGDLFMAMELLKGQTLTELIETRGALPWLNAIHVLTGVLTSLEEAHDAGIVHRDLKPDNIMLVKVPDSKRPLVKVMDFGIAKPVGKEEVTAITRAGSAIGTPEYMSPEQAQSKDIDPRSDLYSTGVLLYLMLVGKVPFQGDTEVETMIMHLSHPPPSIEDAELDEMVPPELDDLFLRLMKKNPARRPACAEDVIDELDAIVAAYTIKVMS